MANASERGWLLERVRELESKNATLDSLVASCQARPSGCKAKIESLKIELSRCASERDENNHQLKEVLKLLDTVQWENDDLKKTKREFELSTNQHIRLQNENEELKTRILKQPQPDVVSDAQLNEKYEHLCGDIEDWTDTHFGELEDVMETVIAAAAEVDWKGKFLRYFDWGLWKMLRPNDPSQLKFLACMIQRVVMHHILSRYAFGVSRELVNGLMMIEKQMKASARDEGKKQSSVVSNCPADQYRC